ncbi:MAG TPA: polysaccharide deacetylase family protein [Jiangellales bacterium]|nr:polysaccharide deacetylase family protein [Jiangellales bacterium]
MKALALLTAAVLAFTAAGAPATSEAAPGPVRATSQLTTSEVSSGSSADATLQATASSARMVDVLARDASGVLWLYRGNGSGGWLSPRLQVGTGWGGMTAVFGPGDFSGDGGGASVDCSRLACVALTFDDGPSAYTDRLIDHLTRLNVPATFFVVGSQVANRPATALRLQRNGHAVENHTYSHPQLTQLSLSAQRSEVQRCDDALAAAGVARSSLLRPPYGSWNSNTRLLGKPLILWSVDPRDWDGRTSSQIRSHVVSNTSAGDIVLMHDRVAATVDAVPGIVSDLRARGFTLVTVETLVPGMEPGDVVYSRGQVQQATTSALSPESAPQLVDEAPFLPGR